MEGDAKAKNKVSRRRIKYGVVFLVVSEDCQLLPLAPQLPINMLEWASCSPVVNGRSAKLSR